MKCEQRPLEATTVMCGGGVNRICMAKETGMKLNSFIRHHQYFIVEEGSNRAVEMRRENEVNFYPKEQDMREEGQ